MVRTGSVEDSGWVLLGPGVSLTERFFSDPYEQDANNENLGMVS